MAKTSAQMPVQRDTPTMSPVTALVHVDANAQIEASESPCLWFELAIQYGWPVVVIAPLLLESFDFQ